MILISKQRLLIDIKCPFNTSPLVYWLTRYLLLTVCTHWYEINSLHSLFLYYTFQKSFIRTYILSISESFFLSFPVFKRFLYILIVRHSPFLYSWWMLHFFKLTTGLKYSYSYNCYHFSSKIINKVVPLFSCTSIIS